MFTSEQIEQLADDAGYDYREYSGRGMYGRQCPGIVIDGPLLPALSSIVAGCDEVEQVCWLLDKARTDDMGRGTIVYWPGIRIDGDDEVSSAKRTA